MTHTPEIIDADVQAVTAWMGNRPDTNSVASFVPGPGIQKLALSFDIARLREALDECLSRSSFQGGMQEQGFAALPLTQRPGQTEWTSNDLSGRYWLRADESYTEEPREDLVAEDQFSEFNPQFTGTYFEEVHQELAAPISNRSDAGSFQRPLQLQFLAPRPRTAPAYSGDHQSRLPVCGQSSCHPPASRWFGLFH